MKKFIALILLALVGFYVAWPAWSGYRIYSALQSQDASLLASKIDFDAVRASLKPSVAGEIEREADKAGGGLPEPLKARLKQEVLPKVVDQTMATLVTPENLLRIYREGGDATGTIRKIVQEKMAGAGGGIPGLGNLGLGNPSGGGTGRPGLGDVVTGLGGLGGLSGRLGGRGDERKATPEPQPVATAPQGGAASPSFGLGNIKGFGLSGPLSWKLGVARDPAAAKPDATIGMSFSGFDWKLTQLEVNR